MGVGILIPFLVIIVILLVVVVLLLVNRAKGATRTKNHPTNTYATSKEEPRTAVNKFCASCGAELEADSAFCTNCGAKQ